jgi:hypothetical protein
MPKGAKIKIHVLVTKCPESHKWSAQGLEHDIVAQADTLKLLEQRFIATVLAYIHAHSGRENPLGAVKPAPKPYWNIFHKLEENDRNSKIKSFPKQSKTVGEAVFLQAA